MRPELLSPAGSPESLRAAVECGADAVYLGWGSFNARQSAKNFSDEEFSAALAYCHERGVKVYLTLNTLVTDRELDAALQCAKTASALGVDAVLVQDLGLFDLMRAALPDLPLHASTQMSLFTSGGAGAGRVRAGGHRPGVLGGGYRPYLQKLPGGDRGLCSRGALHVLLRPVRHERPDWRTVRKPGPVRPALPIALYAGGNPGRRRGPSVKSPSFCGKAEKKQLSLEP